MQKARERNISSVRGNNRLKEEPKKSGAARFGEQLNDPLIFVLFVAAAISMLMREFYDTAIILAVIVLNAAIGVIQEGKADKALASLKKLAAPKAYIRPEGAKGKEIWEEIPAADLLAGDIVKLEAGMQVPADVVILEATRLKVEESALTGESLPVEKKTGAHAYMSTMVTSGSGIGKVCAIGMDTQIGKIAAMMEETKPDATPLQKRLGDLGKLLSILSVLLCTLLFLLALWQGRDIWEMLLTAISLAVAAVPEGLPAIVTMVLALSVSRMVGAGSIVKKLPSVETLGCVSVICTDKTGTLTKNRMTVTECCTGDSFFKIRPVSDLKSSKDAAFLCGFALCNDAVLSDVTADFGDPTEIALLHMAASCGIRRSDLEKQYTKTDEIPFDSERKKMTATFLYHGKKISFTKGSPDEILKCCKSIRIQGSDLPLTPLHRKKIHAVIRDMSAKALRILALSCKEGDGNPEEDTVFLGLAGMKDPLKEGVKEAVQLCRLAGIKTVMITGDRIDTACAIARELRLVSDISGCMKGEELEQALSEGDAEKLKYIVNHIRVFAQVSPTHKTRIVNLLKNNGEIVAMTGDGVNDAPSLKAADVGIAMGMMGTDVAKSAADMILTDDNFATITAAVKQGRCIYANIKKSVLFLLSSNFGEIITMFFAFVLGFGSPLKPSHILCINLVTDSLPALALGTDTDNHDYMKEKPRKKEESLFSGGGLFLTLFYGFLIAALSLFAFLHLPARILHANHLPLTLQNLRALLSDAGLRTACQTYAFTVLGISQLFHAIGMRDVKVSVFRMRHLANKLMLAALFVGLSLQFALTAHPALIQAFGTIKLGREDWRYLLVLSLLPLLTHELLCLFRYVFASVQRMRTRRDIPSQTEFSSR